MTVASVHEVKTHLFRLIAKVLAGEEVVIAGNKEPVVRLVRGALPKKKPLLRPGKLAVSAALAEAFGETIAATDCTPLPVSMAHAEVAGKLDLSHKVLSTGC